MRITLRYGVTKLENVEVSEGTTVNDIIDDFGAALGLPESVDTLINGVSAGDRALLDGDTVTFEKKACAKA
jgi:hypothetical protein